MRRMAKRRFGCAEHLCSIAQIVRHSRTYMIALALLALPIWAVEADKKTLRSATEFAMTYTAAIQAGKGAQAIEEGWNWDVILPSIFGDALKKHNKTEVAEIRTRLIAAMSSHYTNPDINAVLAIGEFRDYTPTAKEDGQVSIEYNFVIGDHKSPNRIVLAPFGNKSWRVVESETDGKAFVQDLRGEYKKAAKVFNPLQFTRILSAEIEKNKQKKPAK